MRYNVAHDEHVTFECSCGSQAIGRFVLPTDKQGFAIVGTCQRCHEQGNCKTTFLILKKHPKDDFMSLLNCTPTAMGEK